MKFLNTVLMLILLQTNAFAYDIGVQQLQIASQERAANLQVTVWYPALPGGKKVILGENIFFEGTPAMRDAPIANSRFPLILLSHGAGLGGRAEAMSWLATPLAEKGFIVVAPTHPGNTGPDRSALETMKLWLRASDLSETLNAIEKNTAFRAHINFDKIGVLGMSMGGGTALSIAGARIAPELLMSYCDTMDLNASLCDWVRLSGVDLRKINPELASRDNQDNRIKFAMAIDPVPSDTFAVNTFSGITIPVMLVNLGKKEDIPKTAQASKVAAVIPDSTYKIIENASHFSMFGLCKPNAPEIAKEEGIDEPICKDGDQGSRSEIHTRLIDMVAEAFGRLG